MNYSNQTEYLIDENLFHRIGSTWTLDTIYVVIIAPLGFIGVIFNLICFWTLLQIKIKRKEINLYKYLKVYSLAGLASSLIVGLAFMTYSPRYFKDFLDPVVKFYRCRIIGSSMVCLFFYINLLDILISLDRMVIFTNKLTGLRFIRPYSFSIFLLIVCFLINSPIFLTYEISSNHVFLTTNVMNHCGLTEFGKSRLGIISNVIVILIRDVLTFILEIITSIFVLYFYRTYKNNSILLNNILRFDIKKKNSNKMPKISDVRSQINKRKEIYKKLLLMTFVLSVLSIITHFLAAIVYAFTLKLIAGNIFLHFSFVCLGIFCFSLKNFLNLFIFYIFNSNFRKKIRTFFSYKLVVTRT